MNFNSGIFLIFLPVVVACYWLLPHRFRKYWLLAASYFFYMYANPSLVVLLLTSTVLDYCCSWGMERNRGNRSFMRLLLMISICGNLGLQDRRYASVEALGGQLSAAIDWDAVAVKFAALKEKTDEYVENAFAGIK